MTRRTRTGCRGLLALALLCVVPAPAGAQVAHATAGALVGAAAGGYLSLGLAVASARTGHYAFSQEDLRWQLTPIPVLAIAGGVLGYQGGDGLRRAVTRGLVGFVGGGAIGTLAVALFGGAEEDVWTGAILGSGLGLLVGSVWGAASGSGQAGEPTPSLTISIPFGP